MCKSIARWLLVFTALTAVFSANALVVKKEDPLRPPEYKLEKSSVDSSVVDGKKPAVAAGWLVREILFSGNRRIAIVNGVAVSKGDRISGARVVDIKPEHVVLNYKDKMITARLATVPVKTKAKNK